MDIKKGRQRANSTKSQGQVIPPLTTHLRGLGCAADGDVLRDAHGPADERDAVHVYVCLHAWMYGGRVSYIHIYRDT